MTVWCLLPLAFVPAGWAWWCAWRYDVSDRRLIQKAAMTNPKPPLTGRRVVSNKLARLAQPAKSKASPLYIVPSCSGMEQCGDVLARNKDKVILVVDDEMKSTFRIEHIIHCSVSDNLIVRIKKTDAR